MLTGNVAIGYSAMSAAGTTSSSNVALGNLAGNAITTGGNHIAIGQGALSSGSGLTSTGTGSGNIAIGNFALSSAGTVSSSNVAVGNLAGQSITTGTGNIIIGNYNNPSTVTGSNEIIISTNGTFGTPVIGKGSNTCFIDAKNGIFGGSQIPNISGSVITPTFVTNKGSYISLFNGVILMWFSVAVTFTANATNVLNWTFPIAFSNGAFFVSAAMSGGGAGAITNQYLNLTTTSVTVYLYNNFAGNQNGTAVLWAVGC